jgi:hypothetical protein
VIIPEIADLAGIPEPAQKIGIPSDLAESSPSAAVLMNHPQGSPQPEIASGWG